MTGVPASARRPGDAPALALVLVGVAALLARPWAGKLASDPTAVLVVLFVALGVVGACWPLPTVTRPAPPYAAVMVTVVGVAPFGAGRLLAGGRARQGGSEGRRTRPVVGNI